MEIGKIEQLTYNNPDLPSMARKIANDFINQEEKKEINKMNQNPEFINYISGELIRSSELNYQLEQHGEPGYQYIIGCDFGLITTNITVTKIVPEGIKIVRNLTPQGLTISEQSLLVKQLWKDYNKSVTILMDLDKLGAAIYDCLRESNIDPRDGEELPPFIEIDMDDEDENYIPDAIKVIKFVRFNDCSLTQRMIVKLKKALEDNVLHFPVIANSIEYDKEKNIFSKNKDKSEIIGLKQEICNIQVKTQNNGMSLKFTTNNEDQINKVSRFTSALLSIYGALKYIK